MRGAAFGLGHSGTPEDIPFYFHLPPPPPPPLPISFSEGNFKFFLIFRKFIKGLGKSSGGNDIGSSIFFFIRG